MAQTRGKRTVVGHVGPKRSRGCLSVYVCVCACAAGVYVRVYVHVCAFGRGRHCAYTAHGGVGHKAWSRGV